MTGIETTDIFRGAFLLCVGGNVTRIRVDQTDRTTATFLITGKDLDQHNRDYVTGKALVNPIQLKNSLNHLRDILFNTLREKENKSHDRTRDHQHHQIKR